MCCRCQAAEGHSSDSCQKPNLLGTWQVHRGECCFPSRCSFLCLYLDSLLVILSLDQEKVFDGVDWNFMHATLRNMGFCTSFLKWVHLFYTGVQSSVNVNGYLSQFFSVSRGVHQGCPLSPLLHVLVAEILACSIRANPRIKGLCLPGSSDPLSLISHYADDTLLVVCSDDAIRACFEVYDVYECGSGSKLNLSKCMGLWLGPWANH